MAASSSTTEEWKQSTSTCAMGKASFYSCGQVLRSVLSPHEIPKPCDIEPKNWAFESCARGFKVKPLPMREIRRQSGLAETQIAYIGDDIGDLEILHRVGLAVTVNDGWEELFRFVDYVTEKPGGRGAVREVAELLLKAQNKWDASAKNTTNINSLR